MKNSQSKGTFGQKYNLKDCGKSVKVSSGTKTAVNSLLKRSDEILEKGREYSQMENRAFGGFPGPGEVGSEKYFKSI